MAAHARSVPGSEHAGKEPCARTAESKAITACAVRRCIRHAGLLYLIQAGDSSPRLAACAPSRLALAALRVVVVALRCEGPQLKPHDPQQLPTTLRFVTSPRNVIKPLSRSQPSSS
eukprot:2791381-Rhodomonas_salina.1